MCVEASLALTPKKTKKMAKKKNSNRPIKSNSTPKADATLSRSRTINWQEIKSNPINILLAKFFGLMILFYGFWASPFIQVNLIEPISCAYAFLAGTFVNLFGYSVSIVRDTIGNSDFSISIKNGCDGVEGLAIFLCAILIYPAMVGQKLKGILLGFSFLIMLNLIRVISLYLIGVHVPSLFDVMHESIWQVLFILLTLVALFKWVGWVKSNSANE